MRTFRLRSAARALACVLGLAAAPAFAATMLYDFENEEDFADWTGYGMKIAPSSELATNGARALGAKVPTYQSGHWKWTAFELKSKEPQDWSGYDRLVVDLRSASKGQFQLQVFVCDRTQPFREHGVNFEFEDPPVMGAKRYVIPLDGLSDAVDRTDMALLHFFATMPQVDVDIAVDRIMLLAPGETSEPLPVEIGRRESAGVPDPLLFDFETDDALDYWVNNQNIDNTLERVAQNATSGQWALHWFTPQYEQGLQRWPSFEYNAPAVMDWRPYDRLVFDVANPNSTPTLLALFISDDRIPFRAALLSGQPPAHAVPLRIEPMANVRVTVDLTRFPATVDRSRIAVLHFWSQFVPGDTNLYLDQFRLLKPGEEQPTLDRARVAESRRRLIESVPPPPEAGAADLPAHARAIAAYRAEYDALVASVEPPEVDENPDDPGGIVALSAVVLQMPLKRARIDAIAAWEAADKPGDAAFILGHAPAMTQIFPRGQTAKIAPLPEAGALRLAGARRENESLQIAVLPRDGALKNVAVSVGELRDDAGRVFPAENIDVDVVGFVNIASPDFHVGGNYVGWWPDPLLDWVEAVDVADGDIQPFWLRFRCPEGQEPGLYKGEIVVTAEGPEGPSRRAVPLEFTVRNFTLPTHSPLPLGMNSFWHMVWRKLGRERAQQVKGDYAAMLERYWIPFDQLSASADFDVLEGQMKRGLLGNYGLQFLPNEILRIKGGPEAGAEPVLKSLERLVPEARRRDMLDHALIYGFDELPMSRGSEAGGIARVIKETYPEIFMLTTAYDKSLGAPGSPMEIFDGFCPLTPSYDTTAADEARARGKKVWWYVCVGPRPPYANFFTNQPSIDARMLMGALTAKYRPDGFLYWSLFYWEGRHEAIREWPFTNWDPVSFVTTYGDGQWLCLGPEDRPVATMRLENFRDGLEDFAYHKILEATLAAAEAAPAAAKKRTVAWRKKAAEALVISADLVRAPNKFTHDEQLLLTWREGLAEALESAPIPLANPWGDFFGPRGFENN